MHLPKYGELVAAPERPPRRILIKDVRVFSGLKPSADEHQDVFIEDGRIAQAAGPADLVIDGHGLTLLPGFVDMHAHLTLSGAPPWYAALPNPEHNAQAHVYAGVTTVLDAGGDPDEIVSLRNKLRVGPRIYFAGPHLTVPGGYPLDMLRDVYGRLAYWKLSGSHSIGVESIEQLERIIDRTHAQGGTFIKLMIATIPPSGAPRLSNEMVRAAVKRAHATGMKVMAHIDTADDALECAHAGVDLLAHGVEAPALTEAQAREIAASGIHVEPTLVNYERFDELADGHYKGSAIERDSESPDVLAAFSDEEIAKHRPEFEKSSFES